MRTVNKSISSMYRKFPVLAYISIPASRHNLRQPHEENTNKKEADRNLEEISRLALKQQELPKERSTRISEENSKKVLQATSTARTKEENIRHVIRQTNMSKPVKTKRQLSRGTPSHDDRDGEEKPAKTGPAPVQITMAEIQVILANTARDITKDLKQQHEEETKQHQNEMKEQQDAMKNLQNKSRDQQQEMQQQKVAIHNLQTPFFFLGQTSTEKFYPKWNETIQKKAK